MIAGGVSQIGGAGEARSEPLLLPDPDRPPPPRLSPNVTAIADDGARRREPDPPAAVPDSPPPERERPVGSRQRVRPFGPLGSLVLHLLPLLLLLDWPLRPPPAVSAIPVQLVLQPPPAPAPSKPSPPKPPQPERRPPPGRLASEDIGDTRTQGRDRAKSEASADTEKPDTAEGPPRAPEQQTAAVIPPPPMPGASGLPDEKLADVPRPKPKPSPRQPPLRRTEARVHLAARPARFPGPAATRDEYLAYLAYLTRKHLNLLPLSLVGGRRGQTVIDILVLDNGAVATLRVGQSSGYPDIDRRIEAMIVAVGRFPPLPQWFQGPSMQLEFTLKFPEALED